MSEKYIKWRPIEPNKTIKSGSVSNGVDSEGNPTYPIETVTMYDQTDFEELAAKAIFDQVNVKDYGAVGDGITDDTEAIQNALDTGEDVFIPKGDIFLVEHLIVGNQKIYGGGTFKLKAQSSMLFNPIIEITAGNVVIDNIVFDGNRDNQPADGYSDSFDTGLNSTGKSNRAGILIDNTSNSASNIKILNCTFYNFYCASIALRGVSDVWIDKNYFYSSNLDAIYAYVKTGTTNKNLWITNNQFNNIYSNDVTVNANCVTISQYDYVYFTNNKGYNCERNLVKFENCNYVECMSNILDTNRIDNFNALQLQGDCSYVNLSFNILKNVNAGIKVEGGTFDHITISNNKIENTLGTTIGDGIILSLASNSIVHNNILTGIARIGIYIIDPTNVKVNDNILRGNGVSFGIYSSANTQNANGLFIYNNNLEDFESSSSGGLLSFTRNSTYTFSNVEIINNRITSEAATNRGIYFTVSGIVSSGKMLHNYVYGTIEHYSSGLTTLNNDASRCIGSALHGNMQIFGSAAPSTGTHYVGEVVINSDLTAGEYYGWKCITAGTPGVWKGFGLVEE